MKLYHAVSTYQLLECLVHKTNYNKDVTCDIIIADYLVQKYPQVVNIKGRFFNNVYMVSSAELNKNKDNLIENTNNVYNDYFNQNHINLGDYSEIIVGCAHFYFGIYLVNNGINFVFLEDGSGILTRPEVIEEIESKLNLTKHNISKEMGLYDGSNPLISYKICNINAQVKNVELGGRVEHFDILEELQGLGEAFSNEMLKFFGITEKIELKDNSIVILTQHFANLNLMTYDEQKRLYHLIVDYFTSNYKVVFKPHPDDLMPYNQLFPGAESIQTKFPSELFPFVFTQSPEMILTVTSTALNSIEGYYKKNVRFSALFEKHFDHIHRYYCCMKLISQFGFLQNIYEWNTNERLLSNIANYSDIVSVNSLAAVQSLEEIPNSSIIVIDDYNVDLVADSQEIYQFLDKLDEESIVIFLNSNREHLYYSFPHKELLQHITPVVIEHTGYADDLENESYSETIFVFSKRSEVKTMVNEFAVVKELKHANKKLEVKSLSEDQMRIKILEGVLEATEKRLLHYIKLEAELRSKLEG